MTASGGPDPLPWPTRWTQPHDTVTDPSARRRARLTMGFLFLLVPLTLAAVAVAAALGEPGVIAPLAAALVLYAIAYWIVRGPHADLGIALFLVSIWTAILVPWWTTVNSGFDPHRGYFTILPVLLGALLLDGRRATFLAIMNLGAAFALFVALPGAGLLAVAAHESLNIMTFLTVASPIVLVGSSFLERSVRAHEATIARLNEVDRNRRELLNLIAHDLASPLNAIQIQLYLLKRQHGDLEPVSRLERSARHMDRLIRDVRDLAHTESERLRLDRKPIDLAEAVRTTMGLFRDQAATHGIMTAVDAPDALAVHGDPDRLDQVLINLVTNALKFTPSGKRITVTAEPVDGAARVMVRDEGRGLTGDEITRLFRPFSQVHAPGEARERGTGLGLYISKGIVEAHGGRIWAESAGHGLGSTFTFEVPLGAPA